MASVQKINGKRGVVYRITVSNGNDSNGKRQRTSTTFKPNPTMSQVKQKKELERFVYEFENKVKRGTYLQGECITLRDFIERWISEYAERQLEPATVSSYKCYIKNHILPILGSYKLSDIKPYQIQGFYNCLLSDGIRADGKSGGYSPVTVRKYHAILSSVFSTAFRWQLIDTNPCTRVKPPRLPMQYKVKFFTLEQTEAFLRALDEQNIPLQYKIIFYMAVYGGFRRGELLALTWDKLDYDKCLVRIDTAASYANGHITDKQPKTKGSIRNVTVPRFIMDMLKALYKSRYHSKVDYSRAYIFQSTKGSQMGLSAPSIRLKNIIKNYNKTHAKNPLPQIGLHGLRHTNATLLIYANTDIKTVSARLGHTQTSTTMNIYAHSLMNADIQCANVLESLINKGAISTD